MLAYSDPLFTAYYMSLLSLIVPAYLSACLSMKWAVCRESNRVRTKFSEQDNMQLPAETYSTS